MSTEWGICPSSTRIGEKSNEIPEMQKVIKEAHGDYCLALKENHKNAYEKIKEYFNCEDFREMIMGQDGQYLKETGHTSDQTITREYFITNDIRWFEDRKEWGT